MDSTGTPCALIHSLGWTVLQTELHQAEAGQASSTYRARLQAALRVTRHSQVRAPQALELCRAQSC